MSRSVLDRLLPDAEVIAKLYREGASLIDLGIRWNCHPNTIKRLLISCNIAMRRPKPKRKLNEANIIALLGEGLEASEVAKIFKVRPETLAEFLLKKSAVIAPESKRG